MKKQSLIVISCVILSACGTTQWDKRGITEQQKQQDLLECEYEAEKATAAVINGFEAGFQKGLLRNKCMKIRGYTATQSKEP